MTSIDLTARQASETNHSAGKHDRCFFFILEKRFYQRERKIIKEQFKKLKAYLSIGGGVKNAGPICCSFEFTEDDWKDRVQHFKINIRFWITITS